MSVCVCGGTCPVFRYLCIYTKCILLFRYARMGICFACPVAMVLFNLFLKKCGFISSVIEH